LKEQTNIIKKYIPEKMKNGSIVVPLSPLDPVIFVYADLYYKDYLNLIYYLGRGYMFVQHIIYYSCKEKTAVMKDLRQMEKLDLIIITKINKNLYVRLTRNGVMYITQNDNAQAYKPATDTALRKSAFICEVQKDIIADELILKKELSYKYFLWFLYGTIKKSEIKNNIFNELNRIEDGELYNIPKDYKDLIDLEQHLNTYLICYKVEQKKIVLDFAIFDVYSSVNEKGIIRAIKEMEDFLGAITGIGLISNRIFEINILICVQNKDREDVLNKSGRSLENTVVNIDNLVYGISDFINIGQLKVKNLKIDRFF